jgi:hypothetical protein
MSPLSLTTYIAELDDRLRYDRGSDTLQKIDVEALNLVRKALQNKDQFFVILVGDRHYFVFYHDED